MADELSIKVNGRTWPVASDPDTPLLYVLSNEVALRGPNQRPANSSSEMAGRKC